MYIYIYVCVWDIYIYIYIYIYILSIYNACKTTINHPIWEWFSEKNPPNISVVAPALLGEELVGVGSSFRRRGAIGRLTLAPGQSARSPPSNCFWLVVFGHPSEKYEFVNWNDYSQYMEK